MSKAYEFEKLHGAGNDFVFIEDWDSQLQLSPETVAHICDRHFGVGADGVILVRKGQSPSGDGLMYYINADGTLAQMCGNGVRCTAKYLVDHGMVDAGKNPIVVDTLSGPKTITYETDESGHVCQATVDMGEPMLAPEQLPTTLKVNGESPEGVPCILDAPVDSPFGRFAFTCVSMGNPHAVCFIDDFDQLDSSLFTDFPKSLQTFNVDLVGSYYESASVFPEKANIEFAHVSRGKIEMRVFERGVRETLACGTGACATGVAAAISERMGRVNDVVLPGGTLHINWAEDNHVFMTGPAAKSFVGTLEI